MATRVGLLSETQNPDETPAEKVKRSAAECLVKRLLAIQLGKYLFKRVKAKSARTMAIPQTIRHRYSGKMPSHKAPGTKTRGPVVEQDGFGRARIVIANMIAAGR